MPIKKYLLTFCLAIYCSIQAFCCAVTVSSSNGEIYITGMSSDANTKLFDANIDNVWECNSWNGNVCTDNETVSGLIADATYFLSVQSVECSEWIPITVQGTTIAASCSDGIQNQDEMGIDCGGTNCLDCSIDLSLEAYQSNENPIIDDIYSVFVKVINSGTNNAHNIEIEIPKPAEVIFISGYIGGGPLIDGVGDIFSIPVLEAGSNVRIGLNYKLIESNAPEHYAQIIAVDETDVDSTPNNGTLPTPNEDDETSVSTTAACNLSIVTSNVTCTQINDWTRLSFQYTLTGTNTPGNWLAQMVTGVDQSGGPEFTMVGGSFPASGLATIAVPNGEVAGSLGFFIPSFNCGVIANVRCDDVPSNDDIDLELSLDQSAISPAQWSNYSVTATLQNTSTQVATDVKVSFPKPVGVVYQGGNPYELSDGEFSAFGNEEWAIDQLAPGASAELTVNYFLLESVASISYAEVIAANENDQDSTPNNGTPPSPNEDDEASTDGAIPIGENINSNFVQDSNINLSLSLKSITPNPSRNGRVEVLIENQVEEQVKLQCYNELGILMSSEATTLWKGQNKISIDVSNFARGTYRIHLPGHNLSEMPVSFVVVK